MLANTFGQAILYGTVTAATFRGAPIVACSDNYLDTFPAAAWANLLTLASQLNAPAIHLDQTHDGGDITPLITALLNLGKFFTPGTAAPWLYQGFPFDKDHPELYTFYQNIAPIVAPLVGPIFFFQYTALGDGKPDFSASGTGAYIAKQVAINTLNFRNNNVYGYGTMGLWLQVGADLDRIQNPPIHTFHAEYDQPAFWQDYIAAYWRAGTQGTQDTFKTNYIAGLNNLHDLESTYPGVTRHFYPPLVAADRENRLFVIPPLT